MAAFKSAKDIKVGVIGYGGAFNMGKAHLSGCKKAGMTPFAVCDRDPARLDIATADWPGIEVYTDIDVMLKKSDVDLIIHITPHNLHYPLAAQCVKAGKHVVTEKPFVVTTSEADRLIAMAKKHKVMVSTYHNRHWDGWILRAKQQIDKGVIGDVYKVEAHMGGYGMPKEWWRTSKTISGGILYDWGVHLLEYALQVVPSQVKEVTGFAHTGYWADKAPKNWPWKKDANEDYAAAIVRFKNGAYINLSISQLNARGNPYMIEFHGTKGCYLINWKEWTTKIAGAKGKVVEKTGKHPKSRGDLFYKNIAQYLVGNEDLIITPQWARRPIHILDLANRSAKQNKTLTAKYG